MRPADAWDEKKCTGVHKSPTLFVVERKAWLAGKSCGSEGFFDQCTCWYSEQRATTVSPYGVFDWDMAIDHVRQVCELPSGLYHFGSPAGTAVLPDHQTVLWMHIGGLYRTDMASGATEQLLCSCNSQYFVGLDYSPQTNKLLTTRVTRTPMNDHDLRIATEIVLMDPDGTDQEVLDIPFPN